MKTVKPFFLYILLPGLVLTGGCATLPDVSRLIDEAPGAREPVRIVSAEGLLSPEKSRGILEQLEGSVAATDILERHAALAEAVTGSPLTLGNKVTLLGGVQAAYAAMFKAIRDAKDHINLETYILRDDQVGREFAELLLEKQAGGVAVNLIFDGVGSRGTDKAFFKRLRDGGVQVVEFNPLNPFRARGRWRPEHPDHRKILVADGKVAVTGGVNIRNIYTDRYSGGRETEGHELVWRDTDVQIEGPAVAEYQKLFIHTWKDQAGPALPVRNYFPAPEEAGNTLVQVVGSTQGRSNRFTYIVYAAAISFARHSIHLTNAFFVPDDQILDALAAAARRGVDVKILLPAHSDSRVALRAQRYTYSALLRAGVKIYERRNAVLHAKTAVIDGIWSTVGSTNMDFWSFSSDDEVNAIIMDRGFASEMETMFADDLAESDQVKAEEWKKRSLLPRLGEWFTHLFFHWL